MYKLHESYWCGAMDVEMIYRSHCDWTAWANSDEDVTPHSVGKFTPFRREGKSPKLSQKALSAKAWAWKEDKKWADQVSDTASTVSTLAELPLVVEDELEVENTFVTLKKPAARRRSSCPPRIRTPCTVMLRHLPNRAKQQRIDDHVQALGFTEYKLHLPIDARTGVNKGYCFVRFYDEETAAEFCRSVDQTQLPAAPGTSSGSSKRLTAVLAANQTASLRPRY